MKKYLFSLLLLIPLMFGCKNKENQIKNLQAKNDSLTTINNQKDKEINDFVMSLNQIQENLDKIRETENLVAMNSKGDIEKKAGAKEKIQEDIQLIYQLMDNNKKTIADLSYRLRTTGSRISEFEKTIRFLSKKITEDSINMGKLREDLENKNIIIKGLQSSVDTLQATTKSQSQTISQQTERLNTAYYVIGTEKELRADKILTKEGGFIGIGKNNRILNNFDRKYFTKINIQEISSIKLEVKKAKILSVHPAGSYKLEQTPKMVSKLVISNPEDFWSISKYLVILIEK